MRAALDLEIISGINARSLIVLVAVYSTANIYVDARGLRL